MFPKQVEVLLRARRLVSLAGVLAISLIGASGSFASPGVAAGAFVDSPAVAIAEVVSSQATYYLAARHAGPHDDFQGTKVTVAKHTWANGGPDYLEEAVLPTEALTWSSYYSNYDGVTYPKLILNATLPTMGDFNLEFTATCSGRVIPCVQEDMTNIYVLEPSYWHVASDDYVSGGWWKGTINGVASRGYDAPVVIGRGASGFFEFPNTL